jgi:hypothetical protein
MAVEDSILAALDPDQRAVALATRGPVCVIAGAGIIRAALCVSNPGCLLSHQLVQALQSRSERLAVVAQAVLSSASTVVACEGNIDVSLPVDEFVSVRQAHA